MPRPTRRCRTAFRRASLSPVGRSAALVIGRQSPDDGTVLFTVTASTPRPLQLRFDLLPDAGELQAALAAAAPTYYDDVHGHPVWREQLTRLFLEEVRSELALA